MDVFDVFQETTYTFLELSQGGILGNTIKSQATATGVFKERNEMNLFEASQEVVESAATLHIRPTETFLETVGGNTVGHGIRASKNGADLQDYRVIGQVEGFNYDTNQLEFYRLTLKAESLAEFENGSS